MAPAKQAPAPAPKPVAKPVAKVAKPTCPKKGKAPASRPHFENHLEAPPPEPQRRNFSDFLTSLPASAGSNDAASAVNSGVASAATVTERTRTAPMRVPTPAVPTPAAASPAVAGVWASRPPAAKPVESASPDSTLAANTLFHPPESSAAEELSSPWQGDLYRGQGYQPAGFEQVQLPQWQESQSPGYSDYYGSQNAAARAAAFNFSTGLATQPEWSQPKPGAHTGVASWLPQEQAPSQNASFLGIAPAHALPPPSWSRAEPPPLPPPLPAAREYNAPFSLFSTLAAASPPPPPPVAAPPPLPAPEPKNDDDLQYILSQLGLK